MKYGLVLALLLAGCSDKPPRIENGIITATAADGSNAYYGPVEGLNVKGNLGKMGQENESVVYMCQIDNKWREVASSEECNRLHSSATASDYEKLEKRIRALEAKAPVGRYVIDDYLTEDVGAIVLNMKVRADDDSPRTTWDAGAYVALDGTETSDIPTGRISIVCKESCN